MHTSRRKVEEWEAIPTSWRKVKGDCPHHRGEEDLYVSSQDPMLVVH